MAATNHHYKMLAFGFAVFFLTQLMDENKGIIGMPLFVIANGGTPDNGQVKENLDSFRINPRNPIKSVFYQYVRKTV